MNSFSSELRTLLSKTDVKSSAIAEAVQYDSSYISKWLSGRATPSERYIDKIAAQISECVVSCSSKENLTALYIEYGTDSEHLKDAIIERLMAAYRSDIKSTASVSLHVEAPLISVIKEMTWNGVTTVAVDIFSMEQESRLLLAGIHEGSFIRNTETTYNEEKNSVRILLNLAGMHDKIYDPIFLIHMMTSFSSRHLELYDCMFSVGRVIYADDDMFLSAHFWDGDHVLSFVKQNNSNISLEMKEMLGTLCTRDSLLVQEIDDLLDGYTYMQSVLSFGHDWITGHFTEQMVPDELFRILVDDIDTDNRLLPQIGVMLKDTAQRSRILIYRSAFTKLLVSGELDFFNHRVILSLEQQQECILYVHSLAEMGIVRIIDGGFSSDFQHISDPCVFLSDSVDYIRLENEKYKNNLWNIVNRNLRKIYHDFFDEIWDYGGDIIIKDTESVLNIIDLYRLGSR